MWNYRIDRLHSCNYDVKWDTKENYSKNNLETHYRYKFTC